MIHVHCISRFYKPMLSGWVLCLIACALFPGPLVIIYYVGWSGLWTDVEAQELLWESRESCLWLLAPLSVLPLKVRRGGQSGL